ncbi:MAG: serine/threonine-protein kinase [Burkholderiales bacterium]|nr:serine/threonine protein kinase [Pseudomonadota bacterium]
MAQPADLTLPEGYQLSNYRIVRNLSAGGFSTVYLAHDEGETPVAIKEYLPNGMVVRNGSMEVQANTPENLAPFRHGMKCFFEEGRTLAQINHPNVVRVENFFRANETVYLVMRYMRGRTLDFHIRANKQYFTESFMRRLFLSLLNGLREVHTHKLLHLDIKPANIYVTMDATPVLLDFGSARMTLNHDRPQLVPMYTKGFAAPEQYRGMAGLGPWTDIYSVGATMYSSLSGTPPQAADIREKEDQLTPAFDAWRGKFSDQLLLTIDRCLELDPLKRPQSVYALQKALLAYGSVLPPKSGLFGTLRRTLGRLGER